MWDGEEKGDGDRSGGWGFVVGRRGGRWSVADDDGWEWRVEGTATHHQQGPDGVVEEDDRRGHEHGEADEFVELGGAWWVSQGRKKGLFFGELNKPLLKSVGRN